MVTIPFSEDEVRTGEYDQSVAKDYNNQLKSAGSYTRQNFGSPLLRSKIESPFDIGKFEITYEEYDYYVWKQRQSGADLEKMIFPTGATRDNGRGQKAVTQVDWNEAVSYTEWLSEKTGDTFRLPTEVEWEYAARAGSETAYWWGDDNSEALKKANCENCGSDWDNQFIAPVGQFTGNAFGLYDTAGNVWEWTCSDWKTELSELAFNCSSNQSSNNRRVIRGGSWDSTAVWLRSSARIRYNTDNRYDNVGFRVVRLSSPPILKLLVSNARVPLLTAKGREQWVSMTFFLTK